MTVAVYFNGLLVFISQHFQDVSREMLVDLFVARNRLRYLCRRVLVPVVFRPMTNE